MLPRLALPPSRAVLAVIALAFVAPGLVGHDPGAPSTSSPSRSRTRCTCRATGLVPRVAGEPWLEDPPFFHWLALAFGKAFGGLLGFHNAVRLASGVAMLAALWFIYLAARRSALPMSTAAATAPTICPRAAARRGGTLLLIGSLGLMVHAHEAVPDLAALAAACAAFAFLMTPGSQSAARPAPPSARRSASRFSPPDWWCPWCWAPRR